jgi:hypothetical protein
LARVRHEKRKEDPGLVKGDPTPRMGDDPASRVWKTGRLQESRIMRITLNKTALFPPAIGGEREKGKRDSSF